MSNVVKMCKNIFPEFFRGQLVARRQWKRRQPGLSTCLAESLFKGCAAASVAFPRNCFAWRPFLCNPLGLPPRRRLIQWFVQVGGTKNQQRHFSNLEDTTTVH
jgi:hypothetical protein